MGWLLLIAGLAFWSGAHFFKRAAPGPRASMGAAGKGLVAGLSLLGIVLMVLGYRWTDYVPVWEPPAFLRHVNNLMMVIAFYLLGVGSAKGTTAGWLRHPMLTGVAVWATAHLLVNGDAAAIVLFGGLLAWALAEMIVVSRARPWIRPVVSVKGDVKALVIGLVVMAVAAGVHIWLGVNPFGG